MELETHGGRDVTESSGRFSLKTLSSFVTPVVRTEDTITQKLLRPKKRMTASKTCNVQKEVKKPKVRPAETESATGGNGNAKPEKGTKASSGCAGAQSERQNARKTRNENETGRND